MAKSKQKDGGKDLFNLQVFGEFSEKLKTSKAEKTEKYGIMISKVDYGAKIKIILKINFYI